jgi:hypothetical protein
MRLHKLKWLNSPTRWKDSLTWAFALLAGVETVFAISEISLKDNLGINCWITRTLVLFGVFLMLIVAIFIFKYYRTKKGISLKIRNIQVNIQQGDIFETKGWKVIPFNEHFDTTVDDKIIAHNTLNGTFIDNYVTNINDLNTSIVTELENNHKSEKYIKNNKDTYPLGIIITFNNEYMLLAFSAFNENNEAHHTPKEYEHCLRVMWKEISRTYANKPVFIPLLGSGITRFEERQHTNSDLLKCMLCTLRTSNADIKQLITILLTEDVIQDINIYEFKGIK